MNTGVYGIKNKLNGKIYVGSAALSIPRRFGLHVNALRRGDHDNSHLQRAWNKYGAEQFQLVVLEYCTPDECISREDYWIKKLKSANGKFGYNLAPAAGSMLGYRHTDQGRANISEGTKRAMQAREVVERVRLGHLKRKSNPNLSVNIAAGIAGKFTEEVRRRLSVSQKRRFKDPKQRYKNSPVTTELVLQIRKLYRWGHPEFGTYGLAKKFGVSQSTIMNVVRNITWDHI